MIERRRFVPSYDASTGKRYRRSRVEVEALEEALIAIVEDGAPMTVRQVYYQATVASLVPKTEKGYSAVQKILARLRKEERLSYDDIADSTRLRIRPRTYNSVGAALREAAQFYRKSLWADAKVLVQVWIEKDALAGVISPVTRKYDVALMVARGYSSLTFLYEAAEEISATGLPTYIYHLGDHDPSGVDAGRSIERTLRELAPDSEIHFERLAVLPAQIREWRLPSRPTKAGDPRAARFRGESVELDAIAPDRLRDLVRRAIERHLPPARYRRLMKEEEALDRDAIARAVEEMT